MSKKHTLIATATAWGPKYGGISVLDPLTGYRLGKSALIVWQRVADSKAEPT